MVFTVAILNGGGGVIMGGFSLSYHYFLKGWLGLNFHRISKWFSSFSAQEGYRRGEKSRRQLRYLYASGILPVQI